MSTPTIKAERRKMTRRCESEEAKAYLAGQPESACPYLRYTTERLYWMQGYDFAYDHGESQTMRTNQCG